MLYRFIFVLAAGFENSSHIPTKASQSHGDFSGRQIKMEGLPNTNVFINQFTDGPSSDDSSGIHKW
jgi:hypothetical protein